MTTSSTHDSPTITISDNIEISPPQRPTLPGAARRVPSFLGEVTIMVDSDNSTRFPGWYDDPDDSSMERFWDGRQWTDSVRDAATASAARTDVLVDLTSLQPTVGARPASDPQPTIEPAPVEATAPVADPTPAPEPMPKAEPEPVAEVKPAPEPVAKPVRAAQAEPVADAGPSVENSPEPLPTRRAGEAADKAADKNKMGLFATPRNADVKAPGSNGAAGAPRETSPTPQPNARTGLFDKPSKQSNANASPLRTTDATTSVATPMADIIKTTAEAAVPQTPAVPQAEAAKLEAADLEGAATSQAARTRNNAKLAGQLEAAKEHLSQTTGPLASPSSKMAETRAKREAEARKSESAAIVENLKPKKTTAKADAKVGTKAQPSPVVPKSKPKPVVPAAKAQQSAKSQPAAKATPSKPSVAVDTSAEPGSNKRWGALAALAGLCLAAGGFLLGFLVGGGDSEDAASAPAPTTEAVTTTIVQTDPEPAVVADQETLDALAAAEARVEELEGDSSETAERIASLEGDVETLTDERDNEQAHNELLQSWFTADVLSRSQGSWDAEVARACALDSEPTIDDLNYGRRLEVVGTPADLLAAVQECRS